MSESGPGEAQIASAAAPASDAVHAPSGRMPDFFIVGHAKSGTTALWEMLRGHPEIFMPSVKEPWFFARETPGPGGAPQATLGQTGVRSETLEQYLSLFSPARPDQRVGEASTSYLWSPAAAARIAKAQPAARIIAILREPASFLRSLHLQLVQNHSETEQDLRKAIALEDARRAGREIPRSAGWPGALLYSERVRYTDQLRNFHASFPLEQVLVLIYEDFLADNLATVRQVLRFLAVDETQPISATSANPTLGVRSVRLHTLLRAIRAGRGPVWGAVKPAVKALTSARLRGRVVYPLRHRLLYRRPDLADQELMIELRRRFSGEVVALSEYLDRDLVTLWGYDRLG